MTAALNKEIREKTLVIASGPNHEDYHFTEEFMKFLTMDTFMLNAASGQFLADGISLHYYTFPMPLDSAEALMKMKRADEFEEKDWYYLLKTTAKIDEIITRHDAIMTHYDPLKKVGLMVDEWGAWYRTEPGTNPAHLFQQNTMRDAVLAAINLNIFNKHSDRVHLTTIAQMVNVLQSIILTEGEKMVLTPTYHVFDMYKDHQDATLLDSYVENKEVGIGDDVINKIYESCSVDANGDMLCTMCNASIDTSETIEATVYGAEIKEIEAIILNADPHAKNTFDAPDTVATRSWKAELTDNGFKVELPAASVVSLKLKVK
jgi:alpha-N-arabinofuranosidase